MTLSAREPGPWEISATRAAACWHLDLAAPEVVSGPQGGGFPTDRPTSRQRKKREKDETDEEIAQLQTAPGGHGRRHAGGRGRCVLIELELQLEVLGHERYGYRQDPGHGELAGDHHHPGLQPVRPHPGRLRHGRDRAHLRAADPVRPSRAAQVLPVARHGVRVVQRRQDDHLHDPPGREVEQRHAVHAGRRRLHLQPGQEQRGHQHRRPVHLQREHVRQHRHAHVPDLPVHQLGADRRHGDRAEGGLEHGRRPGDLRRRQPGRHRARTCWTPSPRRASR